MAFLAYHLIRYAGFRARVLRDAEPVERHGDVLVVASAAASGPIAFGVWRRFVAFPRDFADRFDAQERALALAHELGHHRRRDLHVNLAALVVLAAHWFNPLAWHAFRAFRADQELANDAGVLAGREASARHAYGRAIVKAASPHKLGGAVAATCHLHSITDLKGRLKMLTISPTSRRRVATGAAAVTLLVAGGLGVTASSSAAERIDSVLKAPIAPSAVRLAQAVPTPPAAMGVVAAPALQATASVPPAPPAAPAIAKNDAGETVIHTSDSKTYRLRDARRVIRVDKDGRVTTQGGSADLTDVPDVSSLNCKDGDDGRPAMEDHKNGQRRIVICRNRAQRLASDAAAAAGNATEVARGAMTNALTSLRLARASVASERDLTDDQRRSALAEIDQAITEMTAEIASN